MDEAFKELKGMYGSQISNVGWNVIRLDIKNEKPMYEIERMINDWIKEYEIIAMGEERDIDRISGAKQ